MGCCSSAGGAPKGGADASSLSTPDGDKKGQGRLLDFYVLGEVLGQGAFGIVYASAPRGTKKYDMAVKMVDKYDTPMDEILHETQMLTLLKHPNVVNFHNVYFEKCFVCIVMDRYDGGDLIECMQLHWKEKGKIPPLGVIHVVQQMAAALNHLRTKSCVHRDVKGDNFLTDNRNLLEKGCRVFLSDFGTCVQIKSMTERLTKSCGTKVYWSPEFYRLKYGVAVDIWALGVILYGLIEGRFPFKREFDVMNAEVKLGTQVPAECKDLVMQTLEKNEHKRLTAQQVCEHPWLSNKTSDPNVELSTDLSFKPEDVREYANVAADERRQELVGRLEDQQQAPANRKKVNTGVWHSKFAVNDARKGKTTRYEWWPKEKAKALIEDGGTVVSNDKGEKEDPARVAKLLMDHGIDTSNFGKGQARTIEQFAQEVHHGSAVLMIDASTHNKLVRVVDVVLIRVKAGDKVLVEMSEKLTDGRSRDKLHRLPGTKKDPHENVRMCSQRILSTVCNISPGNFTIKFDALERFEEEEDSFSYPGVQTVYRKTIVEAVMKSTYNPVSFEHTDPANVAKSFQWLSVAECKSKGVMIAPPTNQDDVSALVQAPCGMNVDELREYLKTHSVNIDDLGPAKGGRGALELLSEELLKGESSLMVHGEAVVRVVDVVVLIITKEGENECLVETQEKFKDGTINSLERLPGIKKRPDENVFSAGQKLLAKHLQMDENHVSIDGKKTQLIEKEAESRHYHGIKTLYRRFIINAELKALNTGEAAK